MRLIPQQYLYLCTFCLLISAGLQSQPLPDSTRTRIDQLFKEWDNQHSPGCAIGIVKGDSLIYAKGYGMANLEYGVPNTPHTLFQLASVSKQFTAYCIVLLAREGKLNLNDDIHKYLPDFPDLHEHITILNLLTHTSGIRDYFTLMQIAGKQEDEISTQEEVVRLLHKQQALNFKPG
ncbi:MAG TPA: serine hydrolase domain-containing protein, partial [Bacteroidia bacterium]|nr:serine hydrolase domain-containing protein [Bacteroidia bacterium]